MRIDSPTGANSWLQGNFKGRFKGNLEGIAQQAMYAGSASYAATASYMSSVDFGKNLDAALDDPNNASIFEKLKKSGKLIVSGGILVESGHVEIESGSLRIGRAIAEYLPNEDVLQFRFGSLDPEPSPEPEPEPEPEPTGSCDCCCKCPWRGCCPFKPPFPPPPPGPMPPTPPPCGKTYSPSIDQFPGIGYQG
jgi:hypothetical protein